MGMPKPDGVCAVAFCQLLFIIGVTSLSFFGREPCQGSCARS
jgi:hypothetical protein